MTVADDILAPTESRSASLAFLVAGTVIAAVLAIHWQTTWSLVSIWLRSDTFAHGILVFPATLYLMWRNWKTLHDVELHTSATALGGLALASVVWVMASIADVQVVQQFMLVAMVPLVIWLVLGAGFVRSMTFPLAFLIFAVPFGEALIPHLMEFTATFTVAALKLSGIPVYREGMFFSIPSGDFEVAKACSGIRYLIGSLSLGSLYAYLTYRSYWRRAVFIVAAAIVPIIANGIRAYLIVLLAHGSKMKLAVGVDHLIYGWLFFGIVMFILFMIGRYFRDDDELPDEHIGGSRAISAPSATRLAAVLLPALAIVASGPLFFSRVDAAAELNSATYAPRLPVAANGWAGPTAVRGSWQPQYASAQTQVAGNYRLDDREVTVYIIGYQRQQQDAELINNENRLYDEDRWRRLADVTRQTASARPQAVRALQLNRGDSNLQVWHWFRAGKANTTNPFAVKLTEVREVLAGRADSAALIAIATAHGRDDDGTAVLESFVAAHGDIIAGCIDAPDDGRCVR